MKDIKLRFLVLIKKVPERSNSMCSFIFLTKKIYIIILQNSHESRNLFFTFKSKYLCCVLKKKKRLKTCISRKAKLHEVEACKNLVISLDGSMKIFVFH